MTAGNAENFKMLRLGVIELSRMQWKTPIVFVSNKEGLLRLSWTIYDRVT